MEIQFEKKKDWDGKLGKNLINLREVLPELEETTNWVVAIDTAKWTWGMGTPKGKLIVEKFRTTPDIRTNWLTPAEAVETVLELANKGFTPSKNILSKAFDIIVLAWTERGVLTCNGHGGSLSIGTDTARRMFGMTTDDKYCDTDGKKFYDIYGKEMEPTKKAKKRAKEMTTLEEAIRQLRINQGDRLRHASTMDEVWELASMVKKEDLKKMHEGLVRVTTNAAAAEFKRRKKIGGHMSHLQEESSRFPFVERPDADNFMAWTAKEDGGVTGISLSKLNTKNGEKYILYHPTSKEERKNLLFFTKHFIERYAERNEIDKNEDLDIAISALLRSYLVTPPGVLHFDQVRGRASSLFIFTDGIGLGQTTFNEGKYYSIVKTFLPLHMLKENQLTAVNKLKELDGIQIKSRNKL